MSKLHDDLDDLDLPDALIDWQRVQVNALDDLMEITESYDRDDLVALTVTAEDAQTIARLARVSDNADHSLRDRLSDYDYQLLHDGRCFE